LVVKRNREEKNRWKKHCGKKYLKNSIGFILYYFLSKGMQKADP